MDQFEHGHGQQQLASLRDYVSVVQRRKWIVVQAVVLVPIAAFLYTMRGDPLYQATADVLLNRQNLALTLTGTADPLVSQAPERLAETQAQLAKVPLIARRVSQRLGTRDANWVMAHTGVRPEPNADLLDFSAFDREPAVAVAMANAFAAEYVRYRRHLDTKSLALARRKVERQLDALAKSDQGKSELYETLVGKAQQLETIEALQTSNASVVRLAEGAAKIAPRPKRNAILGLGLGVILGIALAFVREALDTRIRTTEEIERRIGLPLLARLPAPPKHLQRATQLVMRASPTSSAAEPYRLLRTNVEFFNVDVGARSIMVTSSVGQEGKTTTIANLALALSAVGHSVVLVDFDLRRPAVRSYFPDKSPDPSVNDLLRGHATLPPPEAGGDDAAAGRVDVLTARPLRNDSADFLATDHVDELLAELRTRYDYVLIDAPPMLLVGDAMQLSAKVEALLVVARLNLVRRPMLTELKRALEAAPTAKLGLIVTGAETELDYSYAYAYSNYYSRDVREKQA